MKKYVLIAMLVASAFGASAGALVNYTLSLNQSVDPGAYYTGFNEAGKGVHDVYTIGFQINIMSVGGTNVNVGNLAAFCCELQQDVSTANYTFEAQQLYHLAGGTAGMTGTASVGIPTGGIGVQRAAYVNYLFDRYYKSEALTGWECTTANPFTQAFQLAIWEVTHDGDFSLTNATGNIFIGNQSDAGRANAILLASSMLSDVKTANVSSFYTSTNFDICALTNPQYQDILLATKKGSIANQTLEPMLAIPEPTTAGLLCTSGALVYLVMRIRRHLYS